MNYACLCCGNDRFKKHTLDYTNLDESSEVYIKRIESYNQLSKRELKKTFKYAKKGYDVEKSLLMRNYAKLVTDISKEYVGRGVHFFELVSAGNHIVKEIVDLCDFDTVEDFEEFLLHSLRSNVVSLILHQEGDTFVEYVCERCGFVMKFKEIL